MTSLDVHSSSDQSSYQHRRSLFPDSLYGAGRVDLIVLETIQHRHTHHRACSVAKWHRSSSLWWTVSKENYFSTLSVVAYGKDVSKTLAEVNVLSEGIAQAKTYAQNPRNLDLWPKPWYAIVFEDCHGTCSRKISSAVVHELLWYQWNRNKTDTMWKTILSS